MKLNEEPSLGTGNLQSLVRLSTKPGTVKQIHHLSQGLNLRNNIASVLALALAPSPTLQVLKRPSLLGHATYGGASEGWAWLLALSVTLALLHTILFCLKK